MSKQCCKCKETKELDAFYTDKGQPNGRDGYCIICRTAHNGKRMYVNGNYIPKSHPLHTPGSYKTFEEAAFSKLPNYKTNQQGFVYIITNDAWKGWVKVGKSAEENGRLPSYQTYSPHRDYSLFTIFRTKNRTKAEKLAHKKLGEQFEQCNEWFKCNAADAAEILEEIL